MRLHRMLMLALAVLALGAVAHARLIPLDAEVRIAVITQTFSRAGRQSTNRSLSAVYHCEKPAPAGSVATLEVPAGLGVSNPVPVVLHNIDGGSGGPDTDTIVYWGSAERIPIGQPRTRRGRRGVGGVRFPYGVMGMADPTRLTAIDGAVSAIGAYRFRASDVGEGTVTPSDAQNFLDPLQVALPADGRVDFAHPIRIAWHPLPRAVGYRVTAQARTGDGRTVMWENAWRSDSWELNGIPWGLRNHYLLPADVTSVTIPPGIFMGGPVLVRITAVSAQAQGKGAVRAIIWAESITSTELNGR